MGFFSRFFHPVPLVAQMTIHLYGPKAWHPAADRIGPIPTQLWPSNDYVYRLDDYLIDGILGPVSARFSLETLGPATSLTKADIAIQGWLDFLENQVGKLPRELQDFVLSTIDTQRAAFYSGGVRPLQPPLAPGDILLGSLIVDIKLGRWIFTTVKAQPHRMRDVDLVALALVRSLSNMAAMLDNNELGWLMFYLWYGLQKWQVKRPGPFSGVMSPTWSFSDTRRMALEAEAMGIYRMDREVSDLTRRNWLKTLRPGAQCNTVEGAAGRFGFDKTNPIPADGNWYCKRLRCPSGHPYYYHRLGSVGHGPDGHIVDCMELICFGRESRVKLFFDMYHHGPSTFVPHGLGFGAPEGAGTTQGVVPDFPNYFVQTHRENG